PRGWPRVPPPAGQGGGTGSAEPFDTPELTRRGDPVVPPKRGGPPAVLRRDPRSGRPGHLRRVCDRGGGRGRLPASRSPAVRPPSPVGAVDQPHAEDGGPPSDQPGRCHGRQLRLVGIQ